MRDEQAFLRLKQLENDNVPTQVVYQIIPNFGRYQQIEPRLASAWKERQLSYNLG